MRFSCDKCSAKYTIADEKVRGKIVAVKCSKCGNKITVNGKSLVVAPQEEVVEERTRVASLTDIDALRAGLESPAPAPAPAAPKPAAPPPREPDPAPSASSGGLPDGWHAIIDRQQVGPFSGAEVQGQISQGKINARTYMWRDGQGDWKRAADLPLIAAALTPKPAAPPPSKPAVAPAPAKRTASSAAVPKNGARAAEEAKPAEPARRAETKPKAEPPADETFEREERPTMQRGEFDDAGAAEGEGATVAMTDSAGLAAAAGGKPQPEAQDPALDEAGGGGLLSTGELAMLGDNSNPSITAPHDPGLDGPAGTDKDLNSLLFDDAQDMLPTQVGKPLTDLAAAVAGDLDRKAARAGDEPSDPFSQVPDNPNISVSKPGQIGEQTRFFMQKAGVNRRNPPWKIALTIVLAIALPVSILYLLTLLNVGFLQVNTGVDEKTGQAVSVSVFSSEGFGNLRDRLLKKPVKPKPAPTPSPKPPPKVDAAKDKDKDSHKDDGPLVAKPNIDMGSTMSDAERQQMKDALKDTDKAGPKVNEAMLQAKLQVDGKAGLDEKQINEVYAKNAKAFQGCVETELRRNPQFAGGKVSIAFTIGTSGVVIRASVDRPEIDRADIGTCLKEKTKRMVFPSFEGDPIPVELPLILAKGM